MDKNLKKLPDDIIGNLTITEIMDDMSDEIKSAEKHIQEICDQKELSELDLQHKEKLIRYTKILSEYCGIMIGTSHVPENFYRYKYMHLKGGIDLDGFLHECSTGTEEEKHNAKIDFEKYLDSFIKAILQLDYERCNPKLITKDFFKELKYCAEILEKYKDKLLINGMQQERNAASMYMQSIFEENYSKAADIAKIIMTFTRTGFWDDKND